MRKEVVAAIFLGVVLGLLAMGGFWWSRRSDQESSEFVTPAEERENTPEFEKEESLSSDSDIFLEIESPDEGAIVDSEEVEIWGKTVPQAVVVFIYPEGETIIAADDDGLFKGTVVLAGGANEIKINAYDYQGNKEEAILTIVYSTAKL
jgi:hypothetical protein